jgi:hypothetical protein
LWHSADGQRCLLQLKPDPLGSHTEYLDLDAQETLSGIAEVAVALAGFSGLFVALRTGREALSHVERQALLLMLTLSLGAAVISLAPIPLLLFGVPEPLVWLAGCLSMGVLLAVVAGWTTRVRRSSRFPKITWAVLSVTWGFVFLQVVGAGGLFGVPRPAAFAAGLWWAISAAAIQFIFQVVATTRQ